MAQIEFHARGVTRQQSRDWKRRHRPSRTLHLGPLAVVVVTAVVVAFSYSPSTRLVSEVVRQTGISRAGAIRSIELARLTNARGEVILKEAVDKAKFLKSATVSDPPAALHVKSIAFIKAGAITEALIDPVAPGVSVQYTVSGTDTYYDSQMRQTDSRGIVSFNIRPASAGVIDTISVSVVLNGKTAKTFYTW